LNTQFTVYNFKLLGKSRKLPLPKIKLFLSLLLKHVTTYKMSINI